MFEDVRATRVSVPNGQLNVPYRHYHTIDDIIKLRETLNTYIKIERMGFPGGVATLGLDGKVPESQLPAGTGGGGGGTGTSCCYFNFPTETVTALDAGCFLMNVNGKAQLSALEGGVTGTAGVWKIAVGNVPTPPTQAALKIELKSNNIYREYIKISRQTDIKTFEILKVVPLQVFITAVYYDPSTSNIYTRYYLRGTYRQFVNAVFDMSLDDGASWSTVQSSMWNLDGVSQQNSGSINPVYEGTYSLRLTADSMFTDEAKVVVPEPAEHFDIFLTSVDMGSSRNIQVGARIINAEDHYEDSLTIEYFDTEWQDSGYTIDVGSYMTNSPILLGEYAAGLVGFRLNYNDELYSNEIWINVADTNPFPYYMGSPVYDATTVYAGDTIAETMNSFESALESTFGGSLVRTRPAGDTIVLTMTDDVPGMSGYVTGTDGVGTIQPDGTATWILTQTHGANNYLYTNEHNNRIFSFGDGNDEDDNQYFQIWAQDLLKMENPAGIVIGGKKYPASIAEVLENLQFQIEKYTEGNNYDLEISVASANELQLAQAEPKSKYFYANPFSFVSESTGFNLSVTTVTTPVKKKAPAVNHPILGVCAGIVEVSEQVFAQIERSSLVSVKLGDDIEFNEDNYGDMLPRLVTPGNEGLAIKFTLSDGGQYKDGEDSTVFFVSGPEALALYIKGGSGGAFELRAAAFYEVLQEGSAGERVIARRIV